MPRQHQGFTSIHSEGLLTCNDLLLAWVLLESYNKTDGYYHDYRDCTNESPELCQGGDTVLTLDMMRRSMATATDMATVLGETVDPTWATVLAKVTPLCTVLHRAMWDKSTLYACAPLSQDAWYLVDAQAHEGNKLTHSSCLAGLAN